MIKLFKERSYGWILLFYPMHPLWYFLIQKSAAKPHNIHSFIDDIVVYNEWFALAYVFWYVFMFGGLLLLLAWAERSIFLRTIMLLYTGIAISLVIQAAYHSTIDYRPAAETLTGHPFATQVVKMIYDFDKPFNVFPSIHCFGSLALMMGFWHTKMPLKYPLRVLISVIAVTICLSTMFIKQHSSLDFLAAIIITVVLYLVFFLPKWSSLEPSGPPRLSAGKKALLSVGGVAGFTALIVGIILCTGGFAF